MKPRLFHVTVMTAKIVAVGDLGRCIRVEGDNGIEQVRLLKREMNGRTPCIGDMLVEYPGGHLEILTPEAFALKALAGESP